MDPVELAASLDADDPLAADRDRFVIPDPDIAYLDGNSLGRPAIEARSAAQRALDGWAHDLVAAWDRWIDRPLEVGDLLAPVLGAGPGQVVVGESTTVALHRALHAALDARPDRPVVVASAADFPTDRYVTAGVARARGRRVRWVDDHDTARLADAVDDDVAVVVSSVASFTTAALVDHRAVTTIAHDHGALVLWDCSHAAGTVALDLDDVGADLAVGCTYKYLHGGPGAPAFTYVADHAQDHLRQPVHGWFGQRDQFAMGPDYDPVAGIGQWRSGTPGVIGLEVAATGIEIVADAGIAALRTKSVALGELMVATADEWLSPLGFEIAGPRAATERGGHLALRHPDASRIVRAGRDVGVIADFRAPDLVRLGPGPLAATGAEVVDGMGRIHDLVTDGRHRSLPADPGRVT